MDKPKLNILYEKTISEEIKVSIGQLVSKQYPHLSEDAGFNRAQHLTMKIEDTTTGTSISFRLKVFRKIITWMFQKGFTDKPRRLGFFEKIKLNRTFDDTCEKIDPEYRVNKKKEKIKNIKYKLEDQEKKLIDEERLQVVSKEKTLKKINKLKKQLEKFSQN